VLDGEEGSIAKAGDTVLIEYAGTLSDGTIFDSNVGKEPFEFTLGRGQVIAGFESAVRGMREGEVKTIQIPAAQAYGEYKSDRIITIERECLPAGMTPSVGQQLEMQGNGDSLVVTVKGFTEKSVTLDANSPLAGKDLTFDLRLLTIK
jgi:peptidylprolyl isomerase